MDEQNKCLNKIWIEADTHDILLRDANDEGVTIAQLAGSVLDKVAKMRSGGLMNSDDPYVRSYWNWKKAKLQDELVQRVHRAAAMYCDNPTDKMAECLMEMCEDAGMDYTEVLNRAKDDPFSSIVANSRNGTKYGQCMRWLPNAIKQQGGKVQVTALETIASIEGFNKSMLDRVKRAISKDNNGVKIKSERESEGWVWILEEHEQEEQQPSII